jgi:outer membrane protein OmpA-like peptidoglycan-associated protein
MLRAPLAANDVRGFSLLAAWAALVLLALPTAANAEGFSIKVEPGVAIPLTPQQSQRFNLGGGVPIKLLYGLGPYADVTASVSFLGLPLATNSLSPGTGTAWGYGGGLRLKAPRDSEALLGMSPWIDADALYIRTGPLDRFGFATGVGLAFPVTEARKFWLGPFVRYQQIVGNGGTGIDDRDAKILLAGLSFEFGGSPMQPREVAREPAVALAPAVAPEPAVKEPDRDDDGMADKDDRCPDLAGPISNQGCPVYEKVVVKPDKLELKDKIQFARGSPRIEQASHSALDEVVKALQDNRGVRVQIEGHASSEGAEKYNQALSEQRAQAVLDYLVADGVARERLTSKGFSSSVPIDTNATAAGRMSNRRVEFVVSFIIVNDGAAK